MARRRKLNWGPLLWVGVVINVFAGLAFSPVTSAAKIRVVGALPTDQARIKLAVQSVKGKPALRGGAEVALEEVYRRPDLKNAEWSQNLFRRGLLVLTYDRPVALVRGHPNTVLTTRGQFAQTQEDVSSLPEVALFRNSLQPTAVFAHVIELVKVADICSRAITINIPNLWISVQENGAVCLNSGETGRVALGSMDELDLKFEKLAELLEREPKFLSENKELVLLAPSKPVLRILGNQ